MTTPFDRRSFLKTLLAGAATLTLPGVGAGGIERGAASSERRAGSWTGEGRAPGSFSFLLLGDLHFDRLEHHDLAWLERDKPDDLRQVREYNQITREIVPRLFATLRQTILDLNRSSDSRVAFVAQLGDLVEGLCGSEPLALQQDREAIEFLKTADLGVPFLFTKGNHDITGKGALEAFKAVFLPFLAEQAGRLNGPARLDSARYTVEHGDALFCFLDAYDRESLPWLEDVLSARTGRHCFVLLHPPVVPYGARSTWHIFSSDRAKTQRARLLELLGKHNAFVLSGHIHKYSLLVRTTPGGGRFLQLALSSVNSTPEPQAQNVLSGVDQYNANQVRVEPNFSPATEQQRRAVYDQERPFVRQFQYADLPGYAVVKVNGPEVTAEGYSGVTRQLWRSLNLTDILKA